MSRGSAVGIVMQVVMLIVPQLATMQPSSGRHRHVDMKDAHRHA